MSDQKLTATFPIHYPVTYVPYRCRNKEHAYFASEASVEFRPVSRADVRTVLRVASLREDRLDRGWSFRQPVAPKPDGAMREVVEFEGRLWIEAVPAAAVVEGLEKRAGIGTPFVEPYGVKALLQTVDEVGAPAPDRARIYSDRRQIERHERRELSTYLDDGGDKVRADLKRTADAMIAVDGTLYARFREPALAPCGYTEQSRALGFCGAGDGTETYSDQGPRYAICDYTSYEHGAEKRWSLTEHDVALSEWRAGHGRALPSHARIEILDPEVLVACPHVAACLGLAEQALASLWKNPMALRHGVLEHAVELRDALSACGRQITPRLRAALADVARIAPLPESDARSWRRLAEDRPRMQTWNGHHHNGREVPLTRASQVIEHGRDHTEAAELASSALRRLAVRNRRLSWEERALELNSLRGDGAASYELLSSQAVAIQAEKLGIDPREAIRAARDGEVRIFSVRADGPVLLATVDEAADGSLTVREILHGAEEPTADHLALLDCHLETAAPAPAHETAPAMGM